MRRNNVTIQRVRAYEWGSPLTAVSHDGRRPVLIRLDGACGDRKIEAWGEATPRSRGITGDTAKGSWRFVEEALRSLEGMTMPASGRRANRKVSDTLSGLAKIAARTGNPRDRDKAFRGMLAGLDMALVDLISKAGAVPLADFLGAQRRAVRVSASTVDAAAEDIESAVARTLNAPMVKIVGLRTWERAIEVATRVAGMRRAAGTNQSIWLDLKGRLTIDVAVKLVEALAAAIRTGDLPTQLVLEQAVSGGDLRDLAELQARADAAVDPPADRSHQGIVVMGGQGIWSAKDACALAASGVKAVNLNLQRLGGTLGTLQVAHALFAARRDTRVCLSSVPGISAVTGHTMTALAAALPRLDYYALDPAALARTTLTSPELKLDDDNYVEVRDSIGAGVNIDLAPHVHQVTRNTQVPPATGAATFAGRQPNVFDVELTKTFAKGDIDSYLLERAALALGLDTTRLTRHTFVAEHPELGEPIGFFLTMSAGTGLPAHAIAADKELTRVRLREAGVPVVHGASFSAADQDGAVCYAESIGYPVVVKPRQGRQGIGVSTGLQSSDEVRRAITRATTSSFGSSGIVVEEHVAGADYRFMVIGDTVTSVIERQPSSIIGDGTSAVIDLVAQKNLIRRRNPHLLRRPIQLGSEAIALLDRQGLTVEDVPQRGQMIRLSSAGNMSRGGDSAEVLDQTHPSLLDDAIRALEAMPGLDHAGIDFLLVDHRLPADDQRSVVCEINASPQITSHHFPLYGPARDVATDLVRRDCARAGLSRGEPSSDLTVRLEVTGRVQGVGYRQWFARIAAAAGVDGHVANLPSGGVSALLTGPTDAVAAMVARSIIGPRRAVAMQVTTTHAQPMRAASGFEVRP